MRGHFLTKAFTNAVHWKHACDLIQIVNPEKLLLLTSFPDIKHQIHSPSSTECGGGGVPDNDVEEPELALTTPFFSQMTLKGTVSETALRFTDLVRCSVKCIKDYKCPKVV